MAFIAGLSELGGGLLFAFGLVTPLAALAITVVMLNAIGTVHWTKGFFNSAGGFEYNLVLIAVAVGLLVSGPGGFSLHEVLEHLAEGRGPRRVLRKFRPSPLLRVLKLVK